MSTDDKLTAALRAEEQPDLYTFVEYPDGSWQLVTDDGFVADWDDGEGES